MHLALLAFSIGIIAGLRAFTAPTAIAWAVRCNVLSATGKHFSFLHSAIIVWILTPIALLELIGDKLPKTPSRLAAPQFITRIVTGTFSGAAIGHAMGSSWLGIACGAFGALIGTLGGASIRGHLAKAFGKDLPAALLEDLVAIGGAFLVIANL
jgi:uncharacterized membrane protein